MGFMPNDIIREIGLGADIRWIDENKIEALMDSHAPVTLAKLRTATNAQPLCISPPNDQSLLRYVNAHDACTPPFAQSCKQPPPRTPPTTHTPPGSVPPEQPEHA